MTGATADVATLIFRGLALSALGKRDRQHAVVEFGLDPIGIDLDRQPQHARERADGPLAPMVGDPLWVASGRLILTDNSPPATEMST